MLKYTLIVVIFTGLLACGKSSQNEELSIDSTKTEVDKIDRIEAGTTTEPRVVEPETRPASEKHDSEKQPQKRKLDLSLPDDVNLDSGEEIELTEQRLLPNLFDSDQEDQKMKVSGDLIRDADKEKYVESIDGASMSIEIKTN